MCPWTSICFRGRSSKCLDLLSPAPLPPVQKQDSQHMLFATQRATHRLQKCVGESLSIFCWEILRDFLRPTEYFLTGLKISGNFDTFFARIFLAQTKSFVPTSFCRRATLTRDSLVAPTSPTEITLHKYLNYAGRRMSGTSRHFPRHFLNCDFR